MWRNLWFGNLHTYFSVVCFELLFWNLLKCLLVSKKAIVITALLASSLRKYCSLHCQMILWLRSVTTWTKRGDRTQTELINQNLMDHFVLLVCLLSTVWSMESVCKCESLFSYSLNFLCYDRFQRNIFWNALWLCIIVFVSEQIDKTIEFLPLCFVKIEVCSSPANPDNSIINILLLKFVYFLLFLFFSLVPKNCLCRGAYFLMP